MLQVYTRIAMKGVFVNQGRKTNEYDSKQEEKLGNLIRFDLVGCVRANACQIIAIWRRRRHIFGMTFGFFFFFFFYITRCFGDCLRRGNLIPWGKYI